jgi:hypothetical protein
MAYQPPGPYPAMPATYAVPGKPPRPPIPQAALRSYYAILAGALLSFLNIFLVFTEIGSIRSQVRSQYPDFTADRISTLVNLEVAAVVVFGVVGVLLWLWMAWKIRTGRHWARVLSSVFFGIDLLSLLVGGLHFNADETSGSQTTTATVTEPTLGLIFGWLSVVVGLYALVMFWQKSTAPFFRPQNFMVVGGYPYPGQGYPYPGQGYPPAGYPPVPGQGGFMPQDLPPQQQQPGDPWSTPPR